MGLFGDNKKKSQDLNQLSEEEIQKKLYGTFTKTPEPKTLKSSEQDEQRRHRGNTEGANKPNIVAPKSPLNESLPGDEDRDLFSEPQAQENQAQLREQETVTQTEEQEPPQVNKEDVPSSENGQRPESSALKFSPRPDFKPKNTQKLYTKPKPSPKLENVKKLLEKKQNGFQKWLKDAGVFLSELLTRGFEGFADALQGGLQYIYRKRKFFKKLAIGALAVALLFVLFSSVHYLNVKRKEAMGGDKPTVSKENSTASSAAPAKATAENAGEPKTQSADAASEATPETIKSASESAAPTIAASTVGDGRFVVQIATYVTREDAQRVVDQFNAEAWKSFVREMSRTGGRTFYSVYLGRFADYDTAQQVFNDFKQTELSKPFQDAFIRTLSSE